MEKVAEFAKQNNIDIAFIGPEAPLEKGIVDELEKNGIKCVGPCKSAARIETDKSFMRKLFEDYEIDGSLIYRVFDNYDDLSAFLDDFDRDVVVKPVGLTGGKGVKIVGDHLKDNKLSGLIVGQFPHFAVWQFYPTWNATLHKFKCAGVFVD